jgi:hypothetical protein
VLQGDPMALLRTLLVVVTWFVVAQTRCLPALSSWVVYSIALVGGHAALRIARCEYRCKVRPGVRLTDVLGMPILPGPIHWTLSLGSTKLLAGNCTAVG